MAAKILQTGGIPEDLTPPSVAPPSRAAPPPLHCNIPPCVFLRDLGGGDVEEEFRSTHSLQHTAANKRQMSVTQLLTNDGVQPRL